MNNTYDLVRHRAALFDYSSEGRFFLTGADAADAVNAVIAADLEAIPELKALNTVLLDDDGSLIAIVWILKAEDGVWVLCDADRRTQVAARLAFGITERTATCEDRTDTTICLAVVGPLAQEITTIVGGSDILGIPYLGLEPNVQTTSLLCRLGYVGEFEYRFIVDQVHAESLRNQLLDAGAEHGMGLGDTAILPLLMLEMRLLMQQAHIPPGTGPLQAGLHWMVNFRKKEFPGRDAVLAQKTDLDRKAIMLLFDTTVAPPSGSAITLEGQEFGQCVYIAHSPTLDRYIGLGYVDSKFAWVGVVFDVAGSNATAVSAPLFITETVKVGR